jgi:hypothetical protein
VMQFTRASSVQVTDGHRRPLARERAAFNAKAGGELLKKQLNEILTRNCFSSASTSKVACGAVRVPVAFRKNTGRPSGVLPEGIRTRNLARLWAFLPATALYAAAVGGCAPEQGRGISANYTAPDSVTSRPQQMSRATEVTRVANATRRANTGTSTRADLKTPIPLPDRALLVPQPEPNCEFKTQTHPNSPGPDTEHMKLEYELECYRQAEIIVRSRLRRLQVSVGETIKAAILP